MQTEFGVLQNDLARWLLYRLAIRSISGFRRHFTPSLDHGRKPIVFGHAGFIAGPRSSLPCVLSAGTRSQNSSLSVIAIETNRSASATPMLTPIALQGKGAASAHAGACTVAAPLNRSCGL